MRLSQEIGKADFVAALELAAEQHMYGAEYVRAIFTLPPAPALKQSAQAGTDVPLLSAPGQQEVERKLVQYEQYVANRDSALAGARA
jgi:hypothetical protein